MNNEKSRSSFGTDVKGLYRNTKNHPSYRFDNLGGGLFLIIFIGDISYLAFLFAGV